MYYLHIPILHWHESIKAEGIRLQTSLKEFPLKKGKKKKNNEIFK